MIKYIKRTYYVIGIDQHDKITVRSTNTNDTKNEISETIE